jgi:hypothetical protein
MACNICLHGCSLAGTFFIFKLHPLPRAVIFRACFGARVVTLRRVQRQCYQAFRRFCEGTDRTTLIGVESGMRGTPHWSRSPGPRSSYPKWVKPRYASGRDLPFLHRLRTVKIASLSWQPLRRGKVESAKAESNCPPITMFLWMQLTDLPSILKR